MKNFVNKLSIFLQLITPKVDHLGHFFWGFLYAMVGVLLESRGFSKHIIWGIPLFFALTKETFDLFKPRKFNLKDSFLDVVFTIGLGIILYFFYY